MTDIDECEAFIGKCHKEATCNNTHGSYVYTCKPGFIGDGQNCTGTVNSLKRLQIRVNHYNGILFGWSFVDVYFGNVISHVLILQIKWDSYSTKSYEVIAIYIDNLFSSCTTIFYSRNPTKGWKQPWLALFNTVMAYAQQFLHNFQIPFFHLWFHRRWRV